MALARTISGERVDAVLGHQVTTVERFGSLVMAEAGRLRTEALGGV